MGETGEKGGRGMEEGRLEREGRERERERKGREG